MKKIILLATILMFSFSAFGQGDQPKTNEWKGVVLDETNAETIITKFGKPKKDEKSRVIVQTPNQKEFTEGLVKKKFRVLKYEIIEQAKDVQFVVNEKNILVLIAYDPEKAIPVQSFLNAYESLDFQPATQIILGREDNSGYFLQAEDEKGIITATVSYGAMGIVFGQMTKKREKNTLTQSNKTLQGNVRLIQLISKSLINKANTDVLK